MAGKTGSDVDFNTIYAPDSPATHAADLLREQGRELNFSLAAGNFQRAGEVLQQVGSCNWSKFFPGGEFHALDGQSYHVFLVNMATDKHSSSIQLRERMNDGGIFTNDSIVPRLTVTDDRCTDGGQK